MLHHFIQEIDVSPYGEGLELIPLIQRKTVLNVMLVKFYYGLDFIPTFKKFGC